MNAKNAQTATRGQVVSATLTTVGPPNEITAVVNQGSTEWVEYVELYRQYQGQTKEWIDYMEYIGLDPANPSQYLYRYVDYDPSPGGNPTYYAKAWFYSYTQDEAHT